MDTIFHLAFTLLALSLVVTGQTTVGECRYNYEKAGCFHDQILPDRPLTIQILNRRDPSSKLWDGEIIDWNHYHKTLHSLACKCAELAIKKGFPYFGLQYYGECWSGPRHQNYTRDGPSNDCIGVTYKPCVDNSPTECIGKGFTNYIYRANGPREGGWSHWSDWTRCPVSCGIGVVTRTRTCTNPIPKFGGQYCNGPNIKHKECKIANCPIHGNWAGWSPFGLCSEPCGGGVVTRTRTCTNPLPKFGGNDCVGENSNSRACYLRSCDGGWSSWSPYSTCSKTCGNGLRVGRRTCTNPSPLLQGNQCPGLDSRKTKCNDRHCLLTEWSVWGACSKSCAIRYGGTKVRRRACSSTTPDDCIGSILDIKNCPEKSTLSLCLAPNTTPKPCKLPCNSSNIKVCAFNTRTAEYIQYKDRCALNEAIQCFHIPVIFRNVGSCEGNPL